MVDIEEVKIFKDTLINITINGELTPAVPFESTICLKTENNSILTGWLPTHSDMMAEDWLCFDKI